MKWFSDVKPLACYGANNRQWMIENVHHPCKIKVVSRHRTYGSSFLADHKYSEMIWYYQNDPLITL